MGSRQSTSASATFRHKSVSCMWLHWLKQCLRIRVHQSAVRCPHTSTAIHLLTVRRVHCSGDWRTQTQRDTVISRSTIDSQAQTTNFNITQLAVGNVYRICGQAAAWIINRHEWTAVSDRQTRQSIRDSDHQMSLVVRTSVYSDQQVSPFHLIWPQWSTDRHWSPSHQLNTNLHYETTYTRLMHCVVCPFTLQLSLTAPNYGTNGQVERIWMASCWQPSEMVWPPIMVLHLCTLAAIKKVTIDWWSLLGTDEKSWPWP